MDLIVDLANHQMVKWSIRLNDYPPMLDPRDWVLEQIRKMEIENPQFGSLAPWYISSISAVHVDEDPVSPPLGHGGGRRVAVEAPPLGDGRTSAPAQPWAQASLFGADVLRFTYGFIVGIVFCAGSYGTLKFIQVVSGN